MELNKFNEAILDESDIIQGLYTGKLTSLSNVNVTDQLLIQQYNQAIRTNADPFELITPYVEPSCSIEEFDRINQSTWFIPKKYKDFDIASWLLEQCKTEEERTRVLDELDLFFQHNMIDVLVCIKYLVDYMRENKILWGLGRGSSVASYCLYLIGLHKIDSIKYQLDIKEFLKGELNGKTNI